MAAPHSPLAIHGRRRWRLPVVLAMTVLIAYLDRINITLALPLIAEQLSWTESELQRYGGLLMSLFYVGYGLSGLLITPLAARLGPRRGIIIILTLASLFTALSAFLSQFILLFAACRILLGAAEGPHFPLAGKAIKDWFPPDERSRANSILFSGIFLAIILGPLLLVPMMQAFGWRAAFLGLAVAGLAVSVPLVARFVFDTPGQDETLGSHERDWLQDHFEAEELAANKSPEGSRYPLYLLKNQEFLLLLLAGTLNNVVSIGLTSWIPTYLTVTLGVPYEQLTWLASLPYAAGLAGLAFWSQLGDRTNRRGLVAAVGFVILAVLIYVAFTVDSLALTITAMVAAVFCASAYTTAEFAFAQRIIPHDDIATGIGLFNGVTIVLGGALAPLLASTLIGADGAGFSLWLLIVLAFLTAGVMATLGRIKAY